MDSIISEIDSEIARLTQVRSLLSSTSIAVKVANAKRGPKQGEKRKSHLSAEARHRIAEAQRKR